MIQSIGKVPSKKDREQYSKKTEYFKKDRFMNIHDLPLMMGKRSKREKNRIPKIEIPIIKQYKIENSKELKAYWFGHSSILIQMNDKNILIDPILSKYASPFTHLGVKRFSDIPIALDDIPEIDILLLSHDHYDHLDYRTVMAIEKKVKHIVVPLGTESFLKSWDINESKIHSLSWWNNITLNEIYITLTPSQHFSTRNPLHRNASWWCGFLIESKDYCVYYSGDGGYSETFKEIGKKYNIDLAFMECGQYDDAWPYCHLFPEQCAQAILDLDAKWTIPVHWGAYCLCNVAWNDSIERIYKESKRLNINLATPLIGQCVKYSKIEEYNQIWWK